MSLERKVLIERALLCGGFLAAALFVKIIPPGSTSFYPPCLFKTFTGWQCPGCGGTRALHALVSGEFLNAFFLNPLIYLAGGYLICRVAPVAARFLQLLEQKRGYTLGWIIFLIAFTLLRNANGHWHV